MAIDTHRNRKSWRIEDQRADPLAVRLLTRLALRGGPLSLAYDSRRTHAPTTSSSFIDVPSHRQIDAIRLAQRLRSELRGEVRFDDGSRALYATDASNYRQVPIGVVIPRNDDDVRATLAACREFGAPILARGAGTSLAGQSCNVAVVMDFSKYMNASWNSTRKRSWRACSRASFSTRCVMLRPKLA